MYIRKFSSKSGSRLIEDTSLYRTLHQDPKVYPIEGFHCKLNILSYISSLLTFSPPFSLSSSSRGC